MKLFSSTKTAAYYCFLFNVAALIFWTADNSSFKMKHEPCLLTVQMLIIETNNKIRPVQSESSGVKLTRFQIEGWLELIGTPSVDILHQSDCAWICRLSSQ